MIMERELWRLVKAGAGRTGAAGEGRSRWVAALQAIGIERNGSSRQAETGQPTMMLLLLWYRCGTILEEPHMRRPRTAARSSGRAERAPWTPTLCY